MPPREMKAIVHEGFGSPDVLRLDDVETPAPGDGEVLVRVHAASVNPLDWHMIRGTPRIIRLASRGSRPMRPGRDVAGTVVAIGRSVGRLRAGDAVFGACQGAFAEYVCGAETAFAAKPAAVSFEDAAATPIARLTALQGLRDNGHLRAGHKVLINGASGGIGTFAVQIAANAGAEVTAVCRTDAVGLVRRLGAARVIDYTREDLARAPGSYDLILDVVGNRRFGTLRRLLARTGRVVAVGGGGAGGARLGRWLTRALAAILATRFTRRRVVICMSGLDLGDLATLGDAIAARKIEPVIDRRFSLEEAAEAVRYLAAGHARGKIVITIAS